MNNKRFFTEDDLYCAAKKHDSVLLTKFRNPDVGDDVYLFDALNFEIISSLISIIINYRIDNLDSIGVDNNCRTIIEAFSLLKMIGLNQISKEQMKLFRKHYVIVEHNNTYNKYTRDKEKDDEYEKEYNDLMDKICLHYNLKYKEANKMVSDPLFCFKQNKDDKLTYNSLINKYNVMGENDMRYYSLFSLSIHPYFEAEKKGIDNLNGLREESIKNIFDYIFRYFGECKLFLDETEKQSSLDEDLSCKELRGNRINAFMLDNVFNSIKAKINKIQYNPYDNYYIDLLSHLIKDMYHCLSLGFKEQVINKFKSFLENVSLYSLINSKGKEEYNKLFALFLFSSRIQYFYFLKSIKIADTSGIELDYSLLKKQYENNYKEMFDSIPFEEFMENVKRNSLYFIQKDKKSYKQLVQDYIDQFVEENLRADLYTSYLVSCDMEHASGYIFNSSVKENEERENRIMLFIFRYLLSFVIGIEKTNSIDLTNEKLTINCFIEFYK